ncbi:MAG: hypothetical protein MJ196_11385 [Treponemataceae bacterium]|nr:hypothetical protein [Treponemataceae bacterium]
MSTNFSLLYPNGEAGFKKLSDISIHDLGLDFICENITEKYEEQTLFLNIFSKMSDNPYDTAYRCDVFEDIYNNPQMCEKLMEVLGHIDYERKYSGLSGRYEETSSAWELLHNLAEISDYIKSVEVMHETLCTVELKSAGMQNLKAHIKDLYENNGFAELKKDISQLKASTSSLQSVTIGINLNEKYEANGIGLVSFNKKPFTKSNVIENFAKKIASKDTINENAEWNDDFKYHSLTAASDELIARLETMARANDPRTENATFYMDKIANMFIGNIVHKLQTVLRKYVYIEITDITNLIPEFIFYIRFANFIRSMQEKGFKFCKPLPGTSNSSCKKMNAKGIYNFKLLSAFNKEMTAQQIVPNDLIFDEEHLVYILTGANRGGKTTITQAVGLLFCLAQAGLYVPGELFEFMPADGIFTHFPADEDKTMELGRLGEECRRFKQLYSGATSTSLLLLNETYSTTSFEEGYYIARDSVKAILKKGIYTIYNTHMHKLAFDIDEINAESEFKAASLIVKAKNGERSFKVEVAPPEGKSFARDIAEKYGVTFEMLTGEIQAGF